MLTREKDLDKMGVEVEITAELFSDEVKAMEGLQAKLAHALDNTLGIHVDVRLVEPRTIPRSEGKAKRVIDKRKM